MKDLPKSSLAVNRVYFKARPVDGFKSKWIEWMISYDGAYNEKEVMHSYNQDGALDEFLDRVESMSEIELYKFPCDHSKAGGRDHLCDYFEMLDDNHVIPRSLFTPINHGNQIDLNDCTNLLADNILTTSKASTKKDLKMTHKTFIKVAAVALLVVAVVAANYIYINI